MFHHFYYSNWNGTLWTHPERQSSLLLSRFYYTYISLLLWKGRIHDKSNTLTSLGLSIDIEPLFMVGQKSNGREVVLKGLIECWISYADLIIFKLALRTAKSLELNYTDYNTHHLSLLTNLIRLSHLALWDEFNIGHNWRLNHDIPQPGWST
jgi:hypothetical protein